MGWRDRDWAQWTDDERASYYGGAPPRPEASPYRWLLFAVVGVLAVLVASLASRMLRPAPAPPPFNPDAMPHAVVYGWWNVPPVGVHQHPWVQTNTTMICSARQPDPAAYGGYVCTSYSIIDPGQRVVALPPSDPELIAPCSQSVVPGGRRIPCPPDDVPAAPSI